MATCNISRCPANLSAPLLLKIASMLPSFSRHPTHLTPKYLHFHDYPQNCSTALVKDYL